MQSSRIDYDRLKVVNSAAILRPQDGEERERHDVLMKEFGTIFLKAPRIQPGIPNKPTVAFSLAHAHASRPKSRYAAKSEKLTPRVRVDPPTEYDDPVTHDVRYHVARHRTRGGNQLLAKDDLVLNKERNIGVLRLLMKKLPFERTRREHKRAYSLIRDMWPSELSCILDDAKETYPVLKELISVATMDNYHDAGLTVFGNTGLHMILRGSVRPQTLPYIRNGLSPEDDSDVFACPTPLLRRKYVKKLQPGDWFGTLEKVEGRELNSKVLTLITLEPCQFLKISIADYKRILLRIQHRVQNEKMSVVQSIQPYDKWPGLSVSKLAALIEWKSFPVDTVVVAEGEIAPYIAFIRSGKCNVFKQVEAVKTLPTGRKRRILKSVLMGELGEGDSVGEDSILEQRPFTCTIATSTEVELGLIQPHKLGELDVTTRTLLSQSVTPKFGDISEDDIHASFIAQEMKDDWDLLKHNVLLQTINYCGIRPGYGKWSNPLISR